jgi:adenosylcobinamide kinase / adenosylcobinamide-phosphate guanylyltransferase
MAMTLLIGGARAGKSVLASRLASQSAGPVSFIATAQAGDEEMAQRIARHRADRPASWITIEEPLDLEVALSKVDTSHVVILDCLTLWVSNLLLAGRDDDEIARLAQEAARSAAGRGGPSFVVTNEVGSGVHPSSELGRRFRDLLGRVNSIWSHEANEAFLVVAGRTIPLNLPSDS